MIQVWISGIELQEDEFIVNSKGSVIPDWGLIRERRPDKSTGIVGILYETNFDESGNGSSVASSPAVESKDSVLKIEDNVQTRLEEMGFVSLPDKDNRLMPHKNLDNPDTLLGLPIQYTDWTNGRNTLDHIRIQFEPRFMKFPVKIDQDGKDFKITLVK